MKKGGTAYGPLEAPAAATRHRALAATSRLRMLHLRRHAEGGMTVADVAGPIALHPNAVRAHLDQLAESGLVTRHRQPDGSPARTERDPQGAGVRAGRDWGRALAAPRRRRTPVDGLVRVLDRLGFSPTLAGLQPFAVPGACVVTVGTGRKRARR
jgi:DNA-binding transcriptional ArsR family regulator